MNDFFKIFWKDNKRFLRFVFAITLFYGLVFTAADFYTNPFKNFFDLLIIILQWFTISVATFGLLYLLSINRFVFLISFPPLTALCAVLAYFRYTANVSFTPMILDAALDNDLRTSLELVSSELLIFVFCCMAFAIILIRRRFKRSLTFMPLHLAVAVLCLLTTNFFFSNIRKPVSERMPFTVFYTWNKYVAEKESVASVRKDITRGAVCSEDSVTVIFILGEALRSDHLGINGYHRNTTPLLDKEKVISFPAIYSEYTYTNRSLPHILTRADSINEKLAFEEPSFISLFNSCGYHTSWIANQESANTYVYFMKEAQELHYANMGKSVYDYDKWIDGDLLPYLDTILEKDIPKKMVVMHTIGSHWWYNSHYPDSFAKFKPVVKSKIVSSCTPEEIINSYDNTVLYSDYFFHQVINRVRDRKSIVMYLSDHGEALGENNEWLHAHKNPALHQAACFVWMSPAYQEQYPDKVKAAIENAPKKWRTDFLFHSILDAGAIQSPYLVPELNVLKSQHP